MNWFWKKKKQPSDEKGETSEKKKKRLKISELFYNNHFVMVFSVVCALILWFIMAATNTTERPWEITNVPVEVELSASAQEENLKVFDQSVTEATVSVTGNSIIVNRLTSADIKAVASLSPSGISTLSKGMMEYTLPLTPEKVTNQLSDYQLVSVYPKEVTVLVDKYKETSFDIESNIKYGFNDQYFYNTPTLSTDSVTISGPASSVSKVSRVVAEYSTDEVLTSTKVFQCKLVAYDENGAKVEDQYLEYSVKEVDATVSVFPRQTIELVPSAVNAPSVFAQSRMSVTPETIVVAGPEDALKNLSDITLDPVDFSAVNLSNTTFTKTVTLPAGFKNISNTWDVEVKVDLKDYSEKKLELMSKNITVKNQSDTQKVKVLTDSIQIDAVGPEAQVSQLTSDDVYAMLDMAGQTDVSGTVKMPIRVAFTDATGCWVYGKYTVSVLVEKK